MIIDPDVTDVARLFGLDPRLLQAAVAAEGGGQAIVRAVQCSLPNVKDRDEALRITARSAVHAMSDFLAAHDGAAFVRFWGARWAPVGAKNDPGALNQFWAKNVIAGWLGGEPGEAA